MRDFEVAGDVDDLTVIRMPDRRLTRWVSLYTAYRRTTDIPLRRTIAATNSVAVLIDLDTSIRRREADNALIAHSPVLGLSDRPTPYEGAGREHGVMIELTPLGARALFGVPPRELANTRTGFEDLLGVRARLLAEELWHAPDPAHRFRILDHRLSAWLPDGPRSAEPLDRGWRSLTAATGELRIHDLAQRTGLSRQHLSTSFHHEIGLPPKTVGRIARCQQAIRLIIGHHPPPPLHAVAAMCGYADQAHLNRDFRLLVGCTPTALRHPATAHTDLFLGSSIALRPTTLIGARPKSWLSASPRRLPQSPATSHPTP